MAFVKAGFFAVLPFLAAAIAMLGAFSYIFILGDVRRIELGSEASAHQGGA